ncbi:MAG: class I SAM-dependent methyltransferase [Rhizobiaceae bacterium]
MLDIWNERYSRDEFVYGREPNQFLKDNAHHIPIKGSVLCIAEGEGRNAVFLAGLGHEVIAMDMAKSGRDKALRLAKEQNVSIEYRVGNLNNFDFGTGEWDAVIAIFAHTPIELRQKIHGSLSTAIKPNGVFIMEVYSPDQLNYKTGGPKSLDLLFALEDVKREIEGLEFLHAQQTVRDITEGSLHTGLGAVTQIVARK